MVDRMLAVEALEGMERSAWGSCIPLSVEDMRFRLVLLQRMLLQLGSRKLPEPETRLIWLRVAFDVLCN